MICKCIFCKNTMLVERSQSCSYSYCHCDSALNISINTGDNLLQFMNCYVTINDVKYTFGVHTFNKSISLRKYMDFDNNLVCYDITNINQFSTKEEIISMAEKMLKLQVFS